MDNLKNYYLGFSNKKYELSGINPSSPEYETITVSFFEWNISIALIQKELTNLGDVVSANRLKTLFHPQFRDATENMSVHAMIFLKTDDYLDNCIEAGAQEMNDMMSPFGLSLNIQETHENIKKIYIFLSNNPGGLEGKLIQSDEGSGKTLEEMIREDIKIVETTQRLGGMNPSKMKGAEIFLDKMHWFAGFSSLCTYASTCAAKPLMLQKYIDLGMKTLLDEPVEIDSETNENFCFYLNVLLHARKKEFVQMAQTAWTNPQLSPFMRNPFDKKKFLISMKELRAFMKSNQGFKSL